MYDNIFLYGSEVLTNNYCDKQISLRTFGKLTDRELYALDVALEGIAKTITETNDINPDIKITMLFVFKNQMIVDFDFTSTDGVCTRLAILPVYKWRAEDAGEREMSFYIAEEACHLLMGIDDEDLIKTKVLEVLHRARPTEVTRSFILKEMPTVLPYYMK